MSKVTQIPTGEHSKRDGMDRAEEHANKNWKDAAYAIVWRLASQQETLTTDNVWAELKKLDVDTPEHRAMGAVMRQAAREGLIEKTDRVVPTSRACANRRPVAIWKSRVRIADDRVA